MTSDIPVKLLTRQSAGGIDFLEVFPVIYCLTVFSWREDLRESLLEEFDEFIIVGSWCCNLGVGIWFSSLLGFRVPLSPDLLLWSNVR